jgi:hypothetical protein
VAKDILNIQGAMFLFLTNQTFSNVFGTVSVSLNLNICLIIVFLLTFWRSVGHNK